MNKITKTEPNPNGLTLTPTVEVENNRKKTLNFFIENDPI